jgi:hypothetical protein
MPFLAYFAEKASQKGYIKLMLLKGIFIDDKVKKRGLKIL